MDEIIDTGAETTGETSLEDAFDAGWNDEEDVTFVTEGGEGGEEAEETEETAEESETSPSVVENQPETTEKPSEETAEQPHVFELTHNGQKVSKTEAEMTALAQMGMDYPFVREQRDMYRDRCNKNERLVNMVEKVARDGNMTVDQYLDWCERDNLKRTGMTEEEAAREQALRQRESAIQQFEAQQRAAQLRARQVDLRRQNDLDEFSAAYPDVVTKIADAKAKGEDINTVIPEEVWQEVDRGTSLTTAYARFAAKQARSEAEAARNELAAFKKNNNNRLSSTGSMVSAGNGTAGSKDPFLEGWDE